MFCIYNENINNRPHFMLLYDLKSNCKKICGIDAKIANDNFF